MTGSFPAKAALAIVWIASAAWSADTDPIRRALDRMYNFDFAGANRILDARIHAQPDDPLGYTFRAASLLFQELDRLMILEGEFFLDDKRLIEKKKLQADPAIKRRFYEFVEMARRRAQHRLVTQSSDTASLFTMCVANGLTMDYVALIERRQIGSLAYARESHSYAVRLLKADSTFTDAYLTTGLTEYLLGSVPFFLRWILRFDEAEGDKNLAVTRLEKVVATGHYFGPFAKIMLAIIHLREKRPKETERLLAELARDYPENGLMRKELAKVRSVALAP